MSSNWSTRSRKGGVGLKVLTRGIDTTSATGRLVFGIFATLSEFERLILDRTMAGPRSSPRARAHRLLLLSTARTNGAILIAFGMIEALKE